MESSYQEENIVKRKEVTVKKQSIDYVYNALFYKKIFFKIINLHILFTSFFFPFIKKRKMCFLLL